MKKSIAIITAILVMATGNLFASEYKTDQIIVKFRPSSAMNAAFVEDMDKSLVVAVDDADQAIAEMNGRADVAYVEPDYKVEADEVPSDWAYDTNTQWEDVDLPQAWNLTGAGQEVVVAVIDSGCDLDHPELSDALVAGYDFANDDNTPEDDAGHGTRVSGIIAARGNDGGMAGVAWDINIKIMPLKFMKSEGGKTTGYISDAIDAIYYAVDHNADIINASWGFSSYSAALEDAIRYARNNGVLFVSSAGNSGDDNDTTPHYPSNYTLDNMIAVAAMSRYDDLASFSNYGHYSVDVVAPGEGLKTTDNDGGYAPWVSGTSYAAPFVSAIAALVISENPSIGYQDLRDRIVRTSELSGSYSDRMIEAGGCVNAYNALKNLNVHEIPSKEDWTAPAAQSADAGSMAMAGGGGGGGGGCFIETAQGNAWIMILALILFPMFRMSAPRRQE